MKLHVFVGIALVLLTAGTSAVSDAVEGFPGSTWGELRQELPTDGGGENLILNGWIEQGVDWYRWGTVRLNTFATIRYNWDSEGLDWNNYIGPGAGIALNHITPKGNQLRFGAEFVTERYWESDRTEEKAVIFLRWFQYWDLKKK